MAEIVLTSDEVDNKNLPKVCVVCGQKGRLCRLQLAENVNPILSMFLRVNFYRFRPAWLPLCPRHQNYFGLQVSYLLLVLGVCLGFPALVLLVMVASMSWAQRTPSAQMVPGLVCVGGFFLYIPLTIGLAVWGNLRQLLRL